ncbi:MAG: RidA family protein [Anaerolineales bacterium]|nr:MAG: RidA family protein [Anaerolineales bacterium]
MEKKVIKSSKAPKALGPYSVANRAGNFIFCAGQLGLDPDTGNLVSGGVEAETNQALMNLTNVLEEAGSSMEKVVKTTVFLRDMDDFSKMNAVYAQYFAADFPARSTVQVAALPKNAAVEIELIAVVSE